MRHLRKLTALLLTWLLLPLAMPLHAADVVEYYHTDGIGNVRVVTDAAGAVIERHDYLPFGEEWCGTAVCGANRTPGQPRRFTGKERDAETGLDYFGARYYRANTGRFTTVDPVYTWKDNLVDPQRWNRYAYGRNNPLRYTDPDGKVVWLVAIVLAVALVLNNPTVANRSHGPTHETIVPNTVLLAVAGAGIIGGARGVATAAVEIATGNAAERIRGGATTPYTPDRRLPRTKDGNPIPDTTEPHSQLGRNRDGEPAAREWQRRSDGQGITATRDIEFTDHGTPAIHPNPHQHPLTPNNAATAPGGGYQRGAAEPLRPAE